MPSVAMKQLLRGLDRDQNWYVFCMWGRGPELAISNRLWLLAVLLGSQLIKNSNLGTPGL